MERHGIELFVPTHKAKRRFKEKRRVVSIDRPTIPGMVFIHAPFGLPYLKLARSPIVISRIFMGEQPLALNDEEIRQLQSLNKKTRSTLFTLGDTVHLIDVPDCDERTPLKIERLRGKHIRLFADWSPFPIDTTIDKVRKAA